MDDSGDGKGKGVMLAGGLLLLWVAGVCFFAAFHPGGVQNSDGKPAQNPVDIIKWLMVKGGEGASVTTASKGDGGSGSSVTPE